MCIRDRHVGVCELGRLLEQQAGEVDGDVTQADDRDTRDPRQVEAGNARGARAPLGKGSPRADAGQALPRDVEQPIRCGPGRVDDGVERRQQVVALQVPVEVHRPQEPDAGVVEDRRALLDELATGGVIRGDAVPDQPERHRTPVEDVQPDAPRGALQQFGRRCQARRTPTDDRDAVAGPRLLTHGRQRYRSATVTPVPTTSGSWRRPRSPDSRCRR